MIAAPGQEYVLWFVNDSGRAGKACVYQGAANVTFNLGTASTLAWMLAPANPSVWVRFGWQLDYGFAWFNYTAPRSQQIAAAALASTVTMSFNAFGYTFSTPQPGGAIGALTITEDASIPASNNAVAGIAMHGAGTFACGAAPNQNLVYTPAAALSYSITFGNYTFSVNDVLVLSSLNPSGSVSFPPGVYTMTAVLDASNTWSVLPGAPQNNAAAVGPSSGIETIRYEAGRGIVQSRPEEEG